MLIALIKKQNCVMKCLHSNWLLILNEKTFFLNSTSKFSNTKFDKDTNEIPQRLSQRAPTSIELRH